MPSKDSSPVECPPMCRCGHSIMSHDKLMRHTCIGNRNLCGCTAFVPADAETVKRHVRLCPGLPESEHLYCNCPTETAGEPEAHEHDWSEWGAVYHGGDLQWRDCRACGDHETRLPEPEAPEDEHVCDPGATLYYCPTAGEVESSCHGGFDVCCSAPERHIQVEPALRARRPPYAVAYALASGELYEVALSGDAVATAEDGVLKVSHPAGVARIVQVKPIEGP